MLTSDALKGVGKEKPRTKLYTLELSNSLLDYSYPDGNVYLTREAAERRAARMTYSDDCVEYFARVMELKCKWDTDLLGPFLDYTVAHEFDAMDKQCEALKLELMWTRFARTKLQAENAKLHELVRDMWREVASACMDQAIPHDTLREFSDRMRELGVEVEP